MTEKILNWMKTNQLLRIRYVRYKVGPETIFGRIISADQNQFIVYDEDKKIVLNINKNEIDDIESAG